MSRPVATRIPRADLATVPEGMYVIAGETATLKQTNPYGKDYEGPHVKVAHVKSGNTDISALTEDVRRKLVMCIRDDGNLTMEGWVRADQIEIVDADPTSKPSRGGKWVCEACSKDLGTVVLSSRPVCPRCTSQCTVMPDDDGPIDSPEVRRLNTIMGFDAAIRAKMRIHIPSSSLERKE